MKILFALLLSLIFISCTQKSNCVDCERCGANLNVKEVSLEEAILKAKTAPVEKDTTELQESIAKIEEKYGEQWGFCDCVVKGDSINKAFSVPNLPDAEFDRLSKRFDEINAKCQAFRIQDANRTPEQREAHEKKVAKCLKEAGIKN